MHRFSILYGSQEARAWYWGGLFHKRGKTAKFRSLLKRNWAADSVKCLSPAGRETTREATAKLRANRILDLYKEKSCHT